MLKIISSEEEGFHSGHGLRLVERTSDVSDYPAMSSEFSQQDTILFLIRAFSP